MKARGVLSALIFVFLFATNFFVLKADSEATMFHSVEKQNNVVSTTYFKGDAKNENLTPFKKKVNTMNENGECISKVTYIWDSISLDWVANDKMIYSYNNSALVSIERYDWNAKSNNWGKPQVVNY